MVAFLNGKIQPVLCFVKIKGINMKNKNYVVSLYCGDTYLDVYGSVDEDDPTVGHIGAVDIEDVCIADTETSVFEMIYSFGWSKFYEQVQEAYVSRNDA
jgi:hypothetical protein